ncbi:hypothetical protein ABE54_03655 [Bacillus thuringiensis]|nr:hypothetical protein [Bacillus thuringiensis]
MGRIAKSVLTEVSATVARNSGQVQKITVKSAPMEAPAPVANTDQPRIIHPSTHPLFRTMDAAA